MQENHVVLTCSPHLIELLPETESQRSDTSMWRSSMIPGLQDQRFQGVEPARKEQENNPTSHEYCFAK